MQSFTGQVISIKTAQTVRVAVNYIYRHPKYKKIMRRQTKLLVHNELEGIKEGDTVQIVKSKPFSKLKHFKLLKKLNDTKKDNIKTS